MAWVWIVLVVCGCAVVAQIMLAMIRGRKLYEEELREDLQKRGMELVSVKTPAGWDTGPFPKLAVKKGSYKMSVLGVSLTHFQHRVVGVKDKNGKEQEVWARLYMGPSGVRELLWIPELPGNERRKRV